MATRTPPMTATVEHVEDVVTVTVQHDPRQSYSRAVKPRAMKAAGEARIPGTLTLETVDYDATRNGLVDVPEGRTASVYYFQVAPMTATELARMFGARTR